MTLTVLDISVLSALMRAETIATRRALGHAPGGLVLCSPVAAEIQFVLHRLESGSKRRVALTARYDGLRAVLRWSDWTDAAALHFASAKAEIAGLGTPVADLDLIIGSVALSLDAEVATVNVEDFRRIPGLRVVDWG